ncbi:hypothetical protein DL770_011675 [Monosporascus sp. CRB-9-2]|nr:hypothetical protein DL770_011675 [Monosporascus sp. CRB-9-2]
MHGTANLKVIRARFAVAGLALFQTIKATALPPSTGEYHVEIGKHVTEHLNPNDPVAPDGVTTLFLATIYYPTLREPTSLPAPYLSPEIASLYEDRWNFTSGALSSLTSALQENARFLGCAAGRPSYPTFIFRPGGGSPRGDLRDAVRGHDRLPGLLPALVEQLDAPFNTTHFAAFDHSLGGAAAVESLQADVGKPSFLFGMEIHTGEDENHAIIDVAPWATVEESDAPVGSVPGARQVEIVNSFVKAFFDYSLFGRRPLFRMAHLRIGQSSSSLMRKG